MSDAGLKIKKKVIKKRNHGQVDERRNARREHFLGRPIKLYSSAQPN